MVLACAPGSTLAGVGDSTFIAAMAELRRIEQDPALDSAARASARQVVLQQRGLTPASIEQAARALAKEPERAMRVWQAIDRRVAEDTTALPH